MSVNVKLYLYILKFVHFLLSSCNKKNSMICIDINISFDFCGTCSLQSPFTLFVFFLYSEQELGS